MSAATDHRWYVLNSMHMATLCAGREDAEAAAAEYDLQYPLRAPHRAVQMVEVSELEKERTARIEAQTRLTDAQEQIAKSGIKLEKAVRCAKHEAMADERAACALVCENLQPPESCTGVERSLWDVATMACSEAILARYKE